MRVSVKIASRVRYDDLVLKMDPTATLSSVRSKIASELGDISIASIKLIFAGRILSKEAEDGKNITEVFGENESAVLHACVTAPSVSESAPSEEDPDGEDDLQPPFDMPFNVFRSGQEVGPFPHGAEGHPFAGLPPQIFQDILRSEMHNEHLGHEHVGNPWLPASFFEAIASQISSRQPGRPRHIPRSGPPPPSPGLSPVLEREGAQRESAPAEVRPRSTGSGQSAPEDGPETKPTEPEEPEEPEEEPEEFCNCGAHPPRPTRPPHPPRMQMHLFGSNLRPMTRRGIREMPGVEVVIPRHMQEHLERERRDAEDFVRRQDARRQRRRARGDQLRATSRERRVRRSRRERDPLESGPGGSSRRSLQPQEIRQCARSVREVIRSAWRLPVPYQLPPNSMRQLEEQLAEAMTRASMVLYHDSAHPTEQQNPNFYTMLEQLAQSITSYLDLARSRHQ